MGTKLYVGNLSYATNEETLRAVFGEGGRQVRSVSIIIDRETGRSRGFGFVQMASPEEAQAAMAALDGFEVEGRPLRVKEAREREAGGREGGREGGPRRMDNRPGGLPPRGAPRERTGPREGDPERERRPEPREARSGGEGPPRSGFGGFEGGGGYEDRDKAARGRGRGNQKRRGGGERDRGDDDSDSRRGRGRGRDRDWRRDWDL